VGRAITAGVIEICLDDGDTVISVRVEHANQE